MKDIIQFDGLLTVELARDELREAILSGILLPGAELSLLEFSEAREVRASTLRYLLLELENDGLVVVRGDKLFVPLLKIDTAMRAMTVRRNIENELLVRSAASILSVNPETIRYLRAELNGVPLNIESGPFGAKMHELSVGICTLGASRSEATLLHEIQDSTSQYINLGANIISVSSDDPSANSKQQAHAVNLIADVLDRVEGGDGKSAANARIQTNNLLTMYAELAVAQHGSPTECDAEALVLSMKDARIRKEKRSQGAPRPGY